MLQTRPKARPDILMAEELCSTAKKWREVSPELKTQLEKNFERQIEIISRGVKEAKFEELLDKAREEAANNGLTEEILQRLLNEE